MALVLHPPTLVMGIVPPTHLAGLRAFSELRTYTCKDKAPMRFAHWWGIAGVAREKVLATQGCGLRWEEWTVSNGVVLGLLGL